MCLKLREAASEPLDIAEPVTLLAAIELERGDRTRALELAQRVEGLALSGAPDTEYARKGSVLYRLAPLMSDLGDRERAVELFSLAESLITPRERPQTNARRLRYASDLDALGRSDEARAVLRKVEDVYATYPYPPGLDDEVEALRAELGP